MAVPPLSSTVTRVNPEKESEAYVPIESNGEMMITNKVVKLLASMRPCGKGIVRGTKACRVLEGFGRSFRRVSPGLHAKSYPTRRIGTFCSHSWQGWWLAKYLTLLLFYNGLAAAVISSIGAAIAAGLFCFDVLPILKGKDESQYRSSFWATMVGVLLYVMTLLLWRPGTTVFFDSICIDQTSTVRKTRGLVSMGAFLKSSNSMLVPWDASYCSRLWCMFEIAGFLRSRDGMKPKLIMRPTILGPCYLLQTLTVFMVFVGVGLVPDHPQWVFWTFQALVCFCGFYINMAAYRQYALSIENMQDELRGFTLQSATCWCCSIGHNRNGTPVMCDRDCIIKCVSIWFGSPESFEDVVRTEVLSCLTQHLTTQFFTYQQCVITMVPILWVFMDTGSAHVRLAELGHEWLLGARELTRGFAWWLGVAPLALLLGFRICFYLRRPLARKSCDVLLNFPPLLAVVGAVVLMVQLEQLCFNAFRVKSEFLVASTCLWPFSACWFRSLRYEVCRSTQALRPFPAVSITL